jgi:HAE1 family hydrophobic/amphiphilic exporter-1
MVALVAFGLYALFKLQTDELPDIQEPVVAVMIPYPGASPDVVASEVLEPVEEAIAATSGVDKIRSTAMDGFAQVIVLFVYSKEVNQAAQDVRDAISGIRGQLPAEMKEPIYRRFDPGDMPIVSLTLSSNTMTTPELTRIADPGLTRDLRGIPGVAQVTLAGGLQRELTVQLRPQDLRAKSVAIGQIVQTLQLQNLAAPVGSVIGPNEERAIRLRGRLETPADFSQLVVTQRKGQVIRLGEIADVVDGAEEARTAALFDDRQAVGIDILKTKDVSTTKVSRDIRARIAALQKSLPGDARLAIVRDAGERVQRSVSNVEETLVEGAVLTVLVVFVFLNSWRSTVITGLALPVSVIAAFIPVWAFGFTLNTMSLLGLSLAIGLLIDDAIVVRENIVRHVELVEDHFTAAQKGTDEIGLAVAATTFSIVAVFVPVAFMPGVAGQFFKPFALTIACSVLVSLFVSFSLDPMLSAYWADPRDPNRHRGPVSRVLDRFGAWFERQADRYKGVIGWALDHRWSMVALAILSLVGALALQAVAGGFGFVPVSDRSEMTIVIDAPPGSSLDYTRVKSEEVGRLVRNHPEVTYTYTTIGSSEGFGGVDQASMYVRLVPKRARAISQQELGRRLRSELGRIGGVTVALFSSSFGGNQKQIQIEVRGHDNNPATLTRLAQEVAARVRRVPDAVDVALSTKGEKPELEVRIQRGLAGSLGIPVAAVAQALRPAFAGVQAGDWIDPEGRSRDVMVRFPREARTRPAELQQLPIVLDGLASGDGPRWLPLSHIATVETSVGPAQVQRYDRDAVIVVGANVDEESLGRVAQRVNAQLAGVPLPPGYRVTHGGEVESQNEVFGNIFAALGLAVLLMYLILVAQFGSFVDPIAIMISLPLSFIGVVLALIVTRDTLNIMSLIGVILLMGIVAKNAILLIDFAKWSRERGVDRRTAIVEAGRIRLRPIMMTTLALIAGMLPVALGFGEGGDFRAPLGRAVIGGVITSTVLTLVVIPTVYEILDDWREALTSRARAWFAHPAAVRGARPQPRTNRPVTAD